MLSAVETSLKILPLPTVGQNDDTRKHVARRNKKIPYKPTDFKKMVENENEK